jgi:mRNA-degrading endonuclease RelE of RelBE toxin-antitoxin system
MHHIELSRRALRDLRRIDRADRRRLLDVLENDLAAEPQPPNLDVKQLVGHTPWLRLRRGGYRILYRPLTGAELRTLGTEHPDGFLVERIVDRRDLDRATATLPS